MSKSKPDAFAQMVEQRKCKSSLCRAIRHFDHLTIPAAENMLRTYHASAVRLVQRHLNRCPKNGTPENIGYAIACAEIIADFEKLKRGKP